MESAKARADAGRCLWCGKPLPTRRGRGSGQRFCSSGHRHAFRTALTRWATRAFDAGLVTSETLRSAQESARAFGGPFRETPAPSQQAEQP